jgi:hypothetical protein
MKAGAEISWNVLRVRAGYQWNSSPFQSGVGVKGYDLQRHTISAGLGYRGKLIFADLSLSHILWVATLHHCIEQAQMNPCY